MMDRAIHGNRPVFSASTALKAAGDALAKIKADDGLTWADIGAILGKSADQAAKYADGTATMDFITFGRGKREWNGRFTGPFDRLCIDSRPGPVCDRSSLTAVLAAAGDINRMLEDGEITAAEVRDNRACLEAARDALDSQLRKLKPEVA